MTNEFDICQNNVIGKNYSDSNQPKKIVKVYLQQNIFFYMGG